MVKIKDPYGGLIETEFDIKSAQQLFKSFDSRIDRLVRSIKSIQIENGD